MTIPFFVETSEQGSLAACRMFENGAFGEDYAGLKPLMFANFPQSAFHTTETPITDGLRSMNGLNVIATSPPAVEITRLQTGRRAQASLCGTTGWRAWSGVHD